MHDKNENETVNIVNRYDDNERLCKLSVFFFMKQRNKFYIV